jgi:hypothetical protein
VKSKDTCPDFAVNVVLSNLSWPLGSAAIACAPPPPAAGADDDDDAVDVPPPEALDALDDGELELLDPPQAATPIASTAALARSESFDIGRISFFGLRRCAAIKR